MSHTNSNDRRDLIDDLPATVESHFKLALIGAALRVIEQLSDENARSEFDFLQSYLDEAEALASIELDRRGFAARWDDQLSRWEENVACQLPLRALVAEAGLSRDARGLLLNIGLPEEDGRFGSVFEWAQPSSVSQQRPTLALLTAWWRDDDDCRDVRQNVRSLRDLGLINVINPEMPRMQWAFEVSPVAWDVIRGEMPFSGSSWGKFHPASDAPTLAELVLPPDIKQKAEVIPTVLASGETRALTVRGPLHNGRKTLIRAIARAAGYNVLEIGIAPKPDDLRWTSLGALCAMLRAMPLFTFELSPGETGHLPKLPGYNGPQGIALSRQGTLEGAVSDRALVLDLPLPSIEARRQLWSSALYLDDDSPPDWTEKFRLTSGGIFRSAELARTQAALEARTTICEADAYQANRALQQTLENHSVRLKTGEGWDQIVCAPDVLAELRTLADRCRYREKLSDVLGPAHASSVNHGVRALLGGPSGTGKTLAARVLATELQLDLYRLDLSAVVNKYVGETEKNLNQILSRAEELRVILLLDEGDSLLTNRTAVQSSNDRYANLETNFLLQRVESFEGILLITTNALQRIDTAFQRRMDVLIEFRLPDPEERRQLWNLHLPPYHEVSDAWIHEVARRCSLSGGQIRNAALHASLLALGRNSIVVTDDAEKAVLREYRKMGAVCPLRPSGNGRFARCPA
jgi:ATPase family protein associated with various cellular activities (AAA)